MRDAEQSPYLWILLFPYKIIHDCKSIRMRFILPTTIIGYYLQAMRHRAPSLFGRLQPVAGFKHFFGVLNKPTTMHILAFYGLLCECRANTFPSR